MTDDLVRAPDPRAVAARKSRERQEWRTAAFLRRLYQPAILAHEREIERLAAALGRERARADAWRAKARALKAEVRRLRPLLATLPLLVGERGAHATIVADAAGDNGGHAQ